MLHRPHSLAFSLVELSIVLVILGLLTGGILAGQSLIRAAELRSASTEMQRYKTAVMSFRDRYFALPGDFNKAVDFWTSLGGDGSNATCQNLSATGAPTCNGNGNGQIDVSVVVNDERYRAWQHLANAGLIEGSYTGKSGSGGLYHMIGGSNVPASKVGTNSYHIMNGGPGRVIPDSTYNFGGNWGLGDEVRATDSAGTYIPIFAPEEMWNIDTKMDDGRPGYGIIYAYKNASMPAGNACLLTDSTAATAAYNLAERSKQCILLSTLLQ